MKIEKIEKYLDKKTDESEDGAGTMTYTAMHPRYRHGKNITCPFCNKTIDLRKIKGIKNGSSRV